MKKHAAFAFLISLFVLAGAKNDWSQPCFSGACSFDVPRSNTSMGATLSIVSSRIGSSKGMQTSFRQLPPTFRDLWDELEETRKDKEDGVNRDIWGILTSILDEKLSLLKKVSPRSSISIICPQLDGLGRLYQKLSK